LPSCFVPRILNQRSAATAARWLSDGLPRVASAHPAAAPAGDTGWRRRSPQAARVALAPVHGSAAIG